MYCLLCGWAKCFPFRKFVKQFVYETLTQLPSCAWACSENQKTDFNSIYIIFRIGCADGNGVGIFENLTKRHNHATLSLPNKRQCKKRKLSSSTSRSRSYLFWIYLDLYTEKLGRRTRQLLNTTQNEYIQSIHYIAKRDYKMNFSEFASINKQPTTLWIPF